jgi:DNA gyrase/topoisomerase IV subunit B
LFGYQVFDESVYNKLVDVVRTRTIFAAAYAQYTVASSGTNQKMEVYFNDELINVKSISDIAKIMFPNSPQMKTIITPTIDPNKKSRVHYKYSWEACAVLVNTSSFDMNQLSNVNGVVVRDGKHTKHVLNMICDGVKEKISKVFNDKNLKFSPTYVSGNIFLFINSKVPNPSWTGQRKDVLDMDIRKLAGYTLDQKFINAISDKLRD